MIAKINDPSAPPVQPYPKSEAARTETERPAGNAPQYAEKVDLSAKAKEMQRIRQALDQAPDLREAKVEQLKRQIEGGTYRVDPEKVASRMVGESLLDILS